MRHRIHDMEAGTTIELPMTDYSSAKSNVDRFNDAYVDEREWTLTTKGGVIKITRAK